MKKTPGRKENLEGVVTARKCDCCGHHEIGIVTDEGEYFALKQGMRVVVVDESFQEKSDGS
jgi:hypothetical protein